MYFVWWLKAWTDIPRHPAPPTEGPQKPAGSTPVSLRLGRDVPILPKNPRAAESVAYKARVEACKMGEGAGDFPMPQGDDCMLAFLKDLVGRLYLFFLGFLKKSKIK